MDLAGWWVPSKNRAAVVLLHGAGSTRTAVLDQAAVLGSHGYGVLMVDARGHGDSGGRGMDFGWYGERDVTAALNFLTNQSEVTADRIGIVGLSMGGEAAIGAAGADSRVRAVVAEGATTRVAADKAYLAAYGLRGDIQRGIDWGTYTVAGLLSPAPEPEPLRDSVKDAQTDGTPTPVLLITAGKDRHRATRRESPGPGSSGRRRGVDRAGRWTHPRPADQADRVATARVGFPDDALAVTPSRNAIRAQARLARYTSAPGPGSGGSGRSPRSSVTTPRTRWYL